MELILDEWIVREVIDTLYMARTTLLGITGLDSPQDVAKKSANETAFTRRISKAIDIIQQSEQQSLPQELEEAAEKYRRESYGKSILPNIDGPMPEYVGSVKDAFIAGAKWQKEQIMKSPLVSIGNTASEELQRINYENGKKDMKEQMMKEAVEVRVQTSPLNGPLGISAYCCNFPSKHPFYRCKAGDKVKLIIIKEDEQ